MLPRGRHCQVSYHISFAQVVIALPCWRRFLLHASLFVLWRQNPKAALLAIRKVDFEEEHEVWEFLMRKTLFYMP